MGTVRLCVRADLRAGWRAWAALVLLLAVGAGATLGSAAAARRTESAYERGLRSGHAADVNVSADATSDRDAAHALLEKAVRLPDVASAAVAGAVDVELVRRGVIDQRLNAGSALGLTPEDDTFGRSVSRFRVLAGRLSHPDRADEVVITPEVAAVAGWQPGDRVTDVKLFRAQDEDDDGNPIPHLGQVLDLRVVGVVSVPESIVIPKGERDARIIFTPAFARSHLDAPFYYLANVRLRHGAEAVAGYRSRATRLTAPNTALFVSSNSDGVALAERADRPLVSGLWILSAVAFAVTILLAAQVTARQFTMGGTDQGILRAIGLRSQQRLGILMAEAAAVSTIGVAAAIPVAWLVSGSAPVGPARSAEPHPGRTFDAVVLLPGAAVVVAAVLLAVLLPAWLLARRAQPVGDTSTASAQRPSLVADTLGRAGLPLTSVLGARFALQPGRGRSAVPVRSILASLVIAATAASAVIAFRADLQRLTTTPSLYGWNADAEAGTTFGAIPTEAVDALGEVPHLASLTGVTLSEVTIAGHNIAAVGLDQLRGNLYFTITAGRPARGRSEIVLGGKTLRTIHARLHDDISVTIDRRVHHVRIVGIATFPSMGQSRFHETSLGVGAAGASSLLPASDPSSDGTYNWLMFDFTSRDPRADVKALRATLGEAGCLQSDCVITDPRPTDISSYGHAQGIPAGLAGVLGALVAATVWHAVSSATRRRRTDLLILGAVGLRPRELTRLLRWQAVLLVLVAALVGIPVGLVCGRVAWSVFTHNLGIEVPAIIPFVPLAAGVALAVVAALVAATVAAQPLRDPARWRSREP